MNRPAPAVGLFYAATQQKRIITPSHYSKKRSPSQNCHALNTCQRSKPVSKPYIDSILQLQRRAHTAVISLYTDVVIIDHLQRDIS